MEMTEVKDVHTGRKEGFVAFWEEDGFSLDKEISEQRKKVMLAGGVVAAGIFSGLLLSGLSVPEEVGTTAENVPLNTAVLNESEEQGGVVVEPSVV